MSPIVLDLCVRHQLSLTVRGNYRVPEGLAYDLMEASWSSVRHLVPLLEVVVIVCTREGIGWGRLTLDGWVTSPPHIGTAVTEWCPAPWLPAIADAPWMPLAPIA